MKIFLYLMLIMFSVNLSAQVAVDKNNVDGGGLLDFRAEAADLITQPNRGLILPKVETLDSLSVAGTVYFNANNGQVEYIDNVKAVIVMTSSNTNISPLNVSLNELGEGVVISDGTVISNAPGVLVLDSTNKSLILPKVTNPESTITNPQPGMMVYDLSSQSMAVYNGENWSFWY